MRMPHLWTRNGIPVKKKKTHLFWLLSHGTPCMPVLVENHSSPRCCFRELKKGEGQMESFAQAYEGCGSIWWCVSKWLSRDGQESGDRAHICFFLVSISAVCSPTNAHILTHTYMYTHSYTHIYILSGYTTHIRGIKISHSKGHLCHLK